MVDSSRKTGTRRARCTAAMLAPMLAAVLTASTLAAGVVTATAAGATSGLSVTPTDTERVASSSTSPLSDLSVSGDPDDTLQATIATDLGTLSIGETSGLTLAYANDWTGDQSITFSGSQDDINAALAEVDLVTDGTTGTAHVSLTASVAASDYNFLAPNQHFYEYVPDTDISWTDADALAKTLEFEGQHGYLATIPSSAVNDFVTNKIEGAASVWFGARAYTVDNNDDPSLTSVDGTQYQRVWRWAAGDDESPIAGGVISMCDNEGDTCDFANNDGLYNSWYDGEPNNAGNEWAAVTDWNVPGAWNDLNPGAEGISGFVVEFGGKINDNPIFGTGFDGVVTATGNVTVADSDTAPAAPVVTGTAGDSSATLSWVAPADGGSAITGYDLWQNGSWQPVTPTATTGSVNGNLVTTLSTTVTGLTNGDPYTYKVRAGNVVGDGDSSDPVTVTPVTLPGAPTSVHAVAGDFNATVSWTAPADNGASPITRYTVTDTTDSFACITSSTSCEVDGLMDGTDYTFTVHATSAVGAGAESADSPTVTPMAPAITPSSPADTNQPQTGTLPIPSGGSVRLLDGNGAAASTVTVDGQGTYDLDTSSGEVTFTPLLGYVGTPTPVDYREVTSTNTSGTSTFSPFAVTAPAAPAAPVLTPTGPVVSNHPQVTTATIPDGGSVTLLDGNGAAATSVTVTGQGTYTLNTSTGDITFTPILGYAATPTPVGYRVTDAYGQTASSIYAPSAVTAPSAPTAPVLHSATPVVSNQQQHTTATIPSAGSVTLLDGNGVPATTVTVNGQGSFALVPATGVITFSPALGYVGTSTPVGYRVTDAYAQHTDSTYAASAVIAPAGPVASPVTPTVTGASDQPQQTSIIIPTGGSVSLIDGNGDPATTVTVPGQGSYGLDPATGIVTFTPAPGFAGTPTPAGYRITDAYGQGSTATFAPDVVTLVPAPPTAVSAVPGNGTATVTWAAPAVDGGLPVTNYAVTSEPGGTVTYAAAAGSVMLTGLSNGTVYSFTVVAANANGSSAASTAVAATPRTVPDPPSISAAVAADGSVTLDIAAPAGNGGAAVTGYTVVNAPGGTRTPVSAAGPVTIADLTDGVVYTFTVVATNDAGDSAPSAPATATPVDVTGAPSLQAVRTGSHWLKVTVNPPTVTGSGPVTGYLVTLQPGGATRELVGAGAGAVTFTGLRNGCHYTASAVAEYAGVVGDASQGLSGMPLAVPSAPPVRTASTPTSLVVHWRAPRSTGGAKVRAYQLIVSGPGLKTLWVTRPAKSRALTVYGLRPHTHYKVVVRAANSDGWSVWRRIVASSSRAPVGGVPVSTVAGHPIAVGTTINLGGDGAFAYDSAELLPSLQSALVRLAAGARGRHSLVCDGYADFGGNPTHEYQLAMARATAVCNFLKAHGAAVRTLAVSFGGTRPLVTGGGSAARATNRRVTVTYVS